MGLLVNSNRIESSEMRFKQYIEARNRRDLQQSRLEDAYDLTIPNRADFEDRETGEQRNLEIFDSTAVDGVKKFANNIQSILMPPFQRWAKLVAGTDTKSAAAKQGSTVELTAIASDLEKITDIFFDVLDQSNFAQVLGEAMQDLAIGTGIILFEQGTEDKPFHFRANPVSQVAYSEGRNGRLQNFWREFNMPLRQMMLQWPQLNKNPKLKARMKTEPDEKIKFIEGTVLVPGKTEAGDRFLYYLQDFEAHTDLLSELRDWSPWIGFRFAKSTGEAMGIGPVLNVLPTIRAVNRMAEWMERAFKFQALGIYMVENGGVANPYTMILEPGATVSVEPTMSGKDPIRPIQSGGNPQNALEIIQELRLIIRNALFTDPLPPETKSGVSATEISIRQQNWVRENGAAFGRLTVELIEPIIKIGIQILSRMKIIDVENLSVDGKKVAIKYESPLIAIQAQQNVRALQESVSFTQSAFGEQGLAAAYNIPQVNLYVNEQLGVPIDLIKTPDQMEASIKAAQQAQQQAQQAPQQQLQPGTVTQPQLPLAQ